ncbi:MAG: V-type ATP synthase subunit I [Acholeplasmataceae bacterium]|nr:V-type ATP synthase subunit I [Acholeplasmataceae bacterium]
MIVPMKKAKLVVLQEDREKLLRSLQHASVLMLISTEEAAIGDAGKEEAFLQRTEKSLRLMKKYREKPGLIRELQFIDYDEFVSVDPQKEGLLTETEMIDEKTTLLKNERERLAEERAFFLPWQELDIKLKDLYAVKYSAFHTGFLETRNLEELKLLLLEAGSEFKILGSAPEGQALVFANYLPEDAQIMEKVKALGFNEINLPKLDRFVAEILTEKEEALRLNQENREQLENRLQELAKEAKQLEVLNDQVASVSELKKAPVTLTLDTAYFEGWVRSDQVQILEKAVKKATSVYDLEIVDPDPEDNPPTYTKNNRFVSAFETVTNMFSRPNQGDVDPNPVMSIWFWIIFGMMMGDAGYGLVMFILFFVLIRMKKPRGDSVKLYKMLMYSSITTVFWGIMFGSYFGYTWNPILLVPLDDLLKFLIVSLIVGALHVITGILVAAYNDIRQGKIWNAIFDRFSWVLVIVGAGFLFIPSLSIAGIVLALTGALTILLTAGRTKKGIFGKLGSGLYSLYGVTGYASDILSYSRILALSLSSAVIGMVMNMLAEMVMGSVIGYFFAAIIYLIGHVFNLVMGLLSAYVHDSRLQYIEFFGKFYEGGGYPFTPLSYKLKYIDEVNEKEKTKQEVL